MFVSDIGNQLATFSGEEKIQHKIIITWELAEKQADGEPFLVSKFYTLSLNEKATLRSDLESWRGKAFTEEEISDGFDIERLIGVNCYLNIGRNKKERAIVAAVNPIPKGLPTIKGTVSVMPENLKKWIQSYRDKAVEVAQHTVSPDKTQPESDGLPF